jgi:hypothetical protein
MIDASMIPKEVVEAAARFWAKVAQASNGECWQWVASKNHDGYGQFGLKGRSVRSHRIAYILANGLIPDGMFVCHRCDNPSCCNPAHLFIGTCADNNSDKLAKGRNVPPPPNSTKTRRRGEKHHLAKLSEADVMEIRRRASLGETGTALGKEFGIGQQQASRLIKGKSWEHLPLPKDAADE